jgi:ABC-2 type transport system permease protein
VSRQFVAVLEGNKALVISTRPTAQAKEPPPFYSAASAEDAVKAGDVSAALVIPQGWGQNHVSVGFADRSPAIELLSDASDPIASQMVAGLLQQACWMRRRAAPWTAC